MKYNITLEGITYEVEVELEEGKVAIEDEYVAKADLSSPIQNLQKEVKNNTQKKPVEGTAIFAPLPGNILSLKVKQGDIVKKGQVLLVIEAMKMENEVVATVDGIVKDIYVVKGQAVASGEILLAI